MADKYYIFDSSGATPCGDGTASNVAASAGAVGAWSDSDGAILHGGAPAYGTLSAGDRVYIRSKDQNGDVDITFNLTTGAVNVGNTAATSSNPIVWIIDGGTKWAGITGTITWYISNINYMPTFIASNIIVAEIQNSGVVYNSVVTTSVNSNFCVVSGGLVNFKFDYSVKTSTKRNCIYMQPNGFLENPVIKFGNIGSEGIIKNVSRSTCRLVNLDIELTYPTPSAYVFYFVQAYGAGARIYGGRIHGVGATTGQTIFYGATSNYSCVVEAIDFSFPIEMTLSSKLYNFSTIDIYGLDSGQGSANLRNWGWVTSRSDNNPPYLNATLPDSVSTPWAWRLYPQYADSISPAELPISKLFTGTSAIQTISLDFLVATGFSSPDNSNVWIEGTYIDATTGLPVGFSTREYATPSALAAGSGWSTTTWGVVSFTAKKISFTTPTSVKQDTPIVVNFCTSMQSGSANDILFIDPAIQLS